MLQRWGCVPPARPPVVLLQREAAHSVPLQRGGPTAALPFLSMLLFERRKARENHGLDQNPGVAGVWESSFQKLSVCYFNASRPACEEDNTIATLPEGHRGSGASGDLSEIARPKSR